MSPAAGQAPPVAAPPPQPAPAATPAAETDQSRLNNDAFLAAEAIRLGIRVGDDNAASALDADAKLIAEARKLGVRVGDNPEKDWEEPFDDEMERTAILLGIRSEAGIGGPVAAPRRVWKGLPWVVLLVLLMAALGGAATFMKPLVKLLAN